ncbi:hypothetical protein LIER_13566 [Lithospermum erythrorhizon]|uniref:Uncharacterized protein n=1 Tax=Lithospermum erythrorhizon TaxID=34254 RepID=A0AAV3Q027_LITER
MAWSPMGACKALKDMEPKPLAVMETSIVPILDQVPIQALSSSDKGNDLLPAKPRKKTMTSIYLKFFDTAPDGKSRRCRFCGQNYSIATATGNLGRHLSNRHPGYEKSGEVTVSPVLQTVTVAKKPPPQIKAPQMDPTHLNWILIRFLVEASLPPSVVDEEWLSNCSKFLNPSVEIWSEEKFKAVLHDIFKCMQDDVREIMEQLSSKISVTLDFWTNYEQILFMSVTCQWIDEGWSFQKVLLDICRIPSPGGGDEIHHALMKILKFYNLEDSVLSCTHNTNPNALQACQKLKDDIDNQKSGPFFYVPCAAHSLSSIIDDGLCSTKLIISKIRELVLEMNSSSEIFEDFVQCANAYAEGNWRYPLDTSTRWSGNYQMLDIACKANKSMETIILKNDESLGSRMLLSTEEKNDVKILHEFLDPFCKTINNICTSKILTIGLVLFFMDHITEMIDDRKDLPDDPDWLKTAAEKMSIKANNYNEQACNVFTYMTTILDPRIKKELIADRLNTDDYLVEAKNYFMRNYSANPFSSVSNSYASQELEDGGIASFAEEIAHKKRRASMPTASDELTQYLSEPPASLSTDVLEWWKVNITRYPQLSLMARHFLAVQPTAVAPEDLFCQKGGEIDRRRVFLSYETTQALLCIRSWMQFGVKLKYQLVEIDYERLMELASATSVDSNTGKKQK